MNQFYEVDSRAQALIGPGTVHICYIHIVLMVILQMITSMMIAMNINDNTEENNIDCRYNLLD